MDRKLIETTTNHFSNFTLMKCKVLLFAFVLMAGLAAGQNLVPNPSFEDFVQCPTQNSNITDCAGWLNFGNTPDYFHACSIGGMQVPNGFAGFQYPNSGNGMAGLVTYVWQFAPDWPNYRENIGVELTQPLTIGQKYFMSFFINHSGWLEGWQKIGANKLGMKFSNTQYSETSLPPLDNSAHIYTDVICVDTVGWYKIKGSFIADEEFNYLMIGNFFDDDQTDTLIWGGPPFGGSCTYYYVDDVCVTTDSLYNETWTGLKETARGISLLKCFPNPANDRIVVQSEMPLKDLEIFNPMGKSVLYSRSLNTNNTIISVSHLTSGCYIIRAKTHNNQTLIQKIFIQH